MKLLKNLLIVAFIVALLKLLLETATIGGLLYKSFQTAKSPLSPYLNNKYFSPLLLFVNYRYFYQISIGITLLVICLLTFVNSYEWRRTTGSWMLNLDTTSVEPAKKPPAMKRLVNPFQRFRYSWKTKSLKALYHLFWLQCILSLAAASAIRSFQLKPWEVYVKSYFLQPEFLLPIASILLLIKCLHLCKDLIFSLKKAPGKK